MIMRAETAVLLGLFDGVHLGHRAAIEALCGCGAKERLVYSFTFHGLDTKGKRSPLTTDLEKTELILSLGADRVILEDFDRVRNLTPEEFVKGVLLGELGADTVIAGENFRFGKNASGDSGTLLTLCRELGMRAVILPTVKIDGEPVSSTRIRELISMGRVSEASRLLGYEYFITGRVLHGDAVGRSMGIRTVNLSSDGGKLIPLDGVYSSTTVIGGRSYPSVTNVGFKPTVRQDAARGIETHILDYSGDIYDETVKVIFRRYYRPERKFPSRQELIDAIAADIKRRKEECHE